MTTLTAQRDADRRYTFSPSSGFTFADLTPLMKIWLGEGNSETPALTVTLTATGNGSSFVPYSSSLVLTLDKADLAALPEGELFYDITLTDGTGFENALCGGSFELFEDGSEGGCGGCEGGVLTFNTNGQCVTIVLQGGNLAVGASISLAELNAAVAAADASSDSAAASAAAAAASVAAVPALIAGKLDIGGGNAASNILTNLPYLQSGTGAVSRSQKSKNDDVLNAADFLNGLTGTATIAALQAALANALLTGRKLILPPGTYQASGLAAVIAAYLPYAPAFGAGVYIEGAGADRTILDNRQANGFLFDFSTDTLLKFIRGGGISGLTITKIAAGTVANSGGIKVRSGYNFVIQNIVIDGLSGTGMKWECEDGDGDGNVNVRTSNVRIMNCAGWGWDGAAGVGFNENSFLSTNDVFVQNCGTNEATAITGITQANPAVVTSANHGRSNGDIVYIGGVQGMTQVNTSNSEVAYVVAGATTNTFQLTGINSTGFGAYTSGGHVVSARPRSGGVKWKGQISKHDNLAITVSKNVGLYVENGPATAQGLDLSGVVIENPQYCGGIIAGCSEVLSSMGQSYANAAQAGAPCYLGWTFDGTTDVVQGVRFDKHTVRVTADNPDYSQWNMVGSNVSPQTIRVKDTFWKEFGYTRQRRFTSQFRFDAVVSPNITCVAVDATTAIVRASEAMGMGAFVPIRLQYTSAGSVSTGEWASRYITSVSITKPGSDGTYQIYLYDNANVVTAEASATAPVKDPVSGYMVKTGDATRLWVGQLAVSGGNWVTTTGGWLNPLLLGGPQPGVPVWGFFNEADRSWNIKNSANKPSSAGDFTFKYLPAFAAQKVFDLPSIAAGASTTFTMVSGDGALGQVGDWVDAVSASIATGGLVLSGEFTATNTITVTAQNPTAGAIDMASATFYAKFTRR